MNQQEKGSGVFENGIFDKFDAFIFRIYVRRVICQGTHLNVSRETFFEFGTITQDNVSRETFIYNIWKGNM